MCEPNFWRGTSNKYTKLPAIRKSCWPTSWTMSVYCGRHAVFSNLFSKLVKMGPFRHAITISCICNELLRTMILKPDNESIIPRVLPYGSHPMCWGSSMACIHWSDEELCYSCWQWKCGDSADVTKHQMRFIMLRYGGCEFRKILRENPGLENELNSHPYFKNSPTNIRDALFGDWTEATKTWYRVKGEETSHLDVMSLYPYVCKYGNFPLRHPKLYVGSACPRDWIGKVP